MPLPEIVHDNSQTVSDARLRQLERAVDIAIEKAILRRFATDCRARGYSVLIEDVYHHTADAIFDALRTVFEDNVTVFDQHMQRVGFILFDYGNGCDIITDFTDRERMIDLLGGAMRLSEELSEQRFTVTVQPDKPETPILDAIVGRYFDAEMCHRDQKREAEIRQKTIDELEAPRRVDFHAQHQPARRSWRPFLFGAAMVAFAALLAVCAIVMVKDWQAVDQCIFHPKPVNTAQELLGENMRRAELASKCAKMGF